MILKIYVTIRLLWLIGNLIGFALEKDEIEFRDAKQEVAFFVILLLAATFWIVTVPIVVFLNYKEMKNERK